jgi:hypothetical protein
MLKTYAFAIVSLLLLSSISIATPINNCTDYQTLNKSYYFSEDGTVTEGWYLIHCNYNCTNSDCAGSNVSTDMSSVWLVYGTGVVLLVLGTILGIPFGRISGENKDVKKGFNTTMVVKYIFFFVGLFLVYLSLGMAKRVGTVYGSEGKISDATDTAVMVMMITIILFLIVFVIEFIFGVLKSMIESAKFKKEDEWRGRDENE